MLLLENGTSLPVVPKQTEFLLLLRAARAAEFRAWLLVETACRFGRDSDETLETVLAIAMAARRKGMGKLVVATVTFIKAEVL